MHIVGRGDLNGVDLVTFCLEHLAPVLVGPGVGELCDSLCHACGIDVADCGDVDAGMGGETCEVAPAFAIDADCRKVELSVRRGRSAEVAEDQRRAGGGLEEVTTGGQGLWHGEASRENDNGAREIGESFSKFGF